MSKPFLIVANFKCHLNQKDLSEWLKETLTLLKRGPLPKIILCPSYPFLYEVKRKTQKFPSIYVGAQDVSIFEEGAYTGEVSAKQMMDVAAFAIIGHSERRSCFHESTEDINRKISLCQKYGISPIICVSNLNQIKELKVDGRDFIFAYEPIEAIGAGNPENPGAVEKMALEIKKILGENIPVLYGGSVSSENVSDYYCLKNIAGVLIGGASLDPQKFAGIIKKVSFNAIHKPSSI